MVKLFSTYKERYYYIISICGLKIKFKSLKLMKECINKLYKYNAQQELLNSRLFAWANDSKLTVEQKVWYVSRKFYKNAGYFPDFKNPKSFNEKLNWLKFNYNDPLECYCTDKYEFKNYIKEQLGEGYTIPLIGVYDSVNDIDFSTLPEKFVIKTTHGYGGIGVQLVKDKSKLDINFLKYNFNNHLQEWNSLYYGAFNIVYRDIKPKIIIEEYIEELEKSDCDYKLFCFHGKVKCFYLANNFAKSKQHRLSYFDLNGEKLPLIYDNYAPINIKRYQKSKNFDRMIEIAEKLSAPFPFVRVDFYDLKDKLYLGEMTFRPGGAWGKYDPIEWDYKFGEWLDLNKLDPKFVNILPEFRRNK